MKITREDIKRFEDSLYEQEKSAATIEKYIRDINKFVAFAGEEEITKKLTLAYKEKLLSKYKVSSVNSFLVALNRFLEFLECFRERVKLERVQKTVYSPEEKNLTRREYEQLVHTALSKGNERLALIIQTICSTGIRVSELQWLTVEAVKAGEMRIRNKGKNRVALIPENMCDLLLAYMKEVGIVRGAVFVTKGGRRINRSNIWRDMKKLCKEASIDASKVFPHNLRHLYAKVFYEREKDIVKLADLLGHSSVETTRIYLKTTVQEHRRLLEKMGLVLRRKEMEYHPSLCMNDAKRNKLIS